KKMKTFLTTALVVLFCFGMGSCSCTKNTFNTQKATSQEIMTNLNNTSWTLKRLDVDSRDFVPTEDQKELTLSFHEQNYSSSDGCNGQGGDFEVENNKISFTRGMSTMRYCGDEM